MNNNIRKLRCVIPDRTAGKYPRLLSLFDNNEAMTPEYSSMTTFLNHLIGDMESQGISVERFSLFNTSRGIAYKFSDGLLLVPVPVYQKGGTGLFSFHDIESVFKDVDGCGTIQLYQLQGQKKPMLIHTACSRDAIMKRLDCALEIAGNRSPVHAWVYNPDVQAMTDRLSTETYGEPLCVYSPEAEISAEDIARNLSGKPKAEQARILANVIQSLGWNALQSDERKQFVRMVVDKAFHVTAAADMAGIAAQIDEDSAGNKKEAEKGSHSPEQKTVSLPEWENRFIWQRDTETGQSCSLEKARDSMEKDDSAFRSCWRNIISYLEGRVVETTEDTFISSEYHYKIPLFRKDTFSSDDDAASPDDK